MSRHSKDAVKIGLCTLAVDQEEDGHARTTKNQNTSFLRLTIHRLAMLPSKLYSLTLTFLCLQIQHPIKLGKSGGSKVSNLETSAWQRRSIARSNSGVECKHRWPNATCLVTVELGKLCDAISFVKLHSALVTLEWIFRIKFVYFINFTHIKLF